nr:DUF3667 domain-containing protein [uncultured Flavobacterium sp.]
MKCLNCDSEATGSFCYNCGQKTSTDRFSFKHIFQNDIASQYYSIKKSPIFFSLKELATRPGYTIREYILGKRVSHMNYMSLFLLLTTFAVVLDKYAKVSVVDIVAADEDAKEKDLLKNFFTFVRDNPKTYIFITIPIISIFTYLFFKKSKFYFSEHLILNIYKSSALLIITKIVTLFSILVSNIAFLKILNQISSFAIFAYSFWFLYQFFYDKTIYSKANLITRSLFSTIFGMLFSSLFLFIYWLIAYAVTLGKL